MAHTYRIFGAARRRMSSMMTCWSNSIPSLRSQSLLTPCHPRHGTEQNRLHSQTHRSTLYHDTIMVVHTACPLYHEVGSATPTSTAMRTMKSLKQCHLVHRHWFTPPRSSLRRSSSTTQSAHRASSPPCRHQAMLRSPTKSLMTGHSCTLQGSAAPLGLNTDDERLSRDDDAGPDPAIASPPRLVRVPVPGDKGELTPPSATRSLSVRPPTPLLTVRRHPQPPPQPHCTTHDPSVLLCPCVSLQAAQLARFNNANRPQPAMARRQRRRRKVIVHAATADAGTMLTGMQQYPIGE